jgi:hypothetical protein
LHGQQEVYPTMLPQHMIWDCNLNRLVLGFDSMHIIGFEESHLNNEHVREAGFIDNHVTDLSGNAFAGQVIVGLLPSLFANWRILAIDGAANVPVGTSSAGTAAEHVVDEDNQFASLLDL